MGRKCFINKRDREQKNTKQGNEQIIPHSKHPSPPHLLRLMAGTDINKELTITTEMSKKTRARGRKGARGIDSL